SVLEVAELKVEIRRTMSGKMRGFEERRRKGFGYFITPEQIERRQPQRSSDMLRGVPGVTVGASQALGPAPVYFRGGSLSGRCEPKLYLDGQPMVQMAFDDITAGDLMAIEIYKGASEMPAQWATGGSCGLLVVWTKDGSSRSSLRP
ncbi:MAG: Plug domain-containing protein, partial [Gemmatimonadota bacterium]